jgi:hypothetical protein
MNFDPMGLQSMYGNGYGGQGMGMNMNMGMNEMNMNGFNPAGGQGGSGVSWNGQTSAAAWSGPDNFNPNANGLGATGMGDFGANAGYGSSTVPSRDYVNANGNHGHSHIHHQFQAYGQNAKFQNHGIYGNQGQSNFQNRGRGANQYHSMGQGSRQGSGSFHHLSPNPSTTAETGITKGYWGERAPLPTRDVSEIPRSSANGSKAGSTPPGKSDKTGATNHSNEVKEDLSDAAVAENKMAANTPTNATTDIAATESGRMDGDSGGKPHPDPISTLTEEHDQPAPIATFTSDDPPQREYPLVTPFTQQLDYSAGSGSTGFLTRDRGAAFPSTVSRGRGGFGPSFRGRGAYSGTLGRGMPGYVPTGPAGAYALNGAAQLNTAPLSHPTIPAGAPSGPKAMRDGGAHRGRGRGIFSAMGGRGGFVGANGSAEKKDHESKTNEPDGHPESRDRSRDQSRDQSRDRSRDRSRSHRRSRSPTEMDRKSSKRHRHHRDRSYSEEYDSERERRRERRRKRKYDEEAGNIASEKAERGRDRGSSVESKATSRRHRDRDDRDKDRSRRHRSHRERSSHRSSQRDRERERERSRDRDSRRSHRKDRKRSRSPADDVDEIDAAVSAIAENERKAKSKSYRDRKLIHEGEGDRERGSKRDRSASPKNSSRHKKDEEPTAELNSHDRERQEYAKARLLKEQQRMAELKKSSSRRGGERDEDLEEDDNRRHRKDRKRHRVKYEDEESDEARAMRVEAEREAGRWE